MPNAAPSRPEGPSLVRFGCNIAPFSLEYGLPHDAVWCPRQSCLKVSATDLHQTVSNPAIHTYLDATH